MSVALICTCDCGRQHVSREFDLGSAWVMLAIVDEIAAAGWGHDARGRRRCPECMKLLNEGDLHEHAHGNAPQATEEER